MTQKEIKTFFEAIRDRDFMKVQKMVRLDKEFVEVCNFAPPQKDDGQSGLQVAFKTGNFDIARMLIDEGADVNFMEDSELNEWKVPVLHDCIRATMFSTFTMEKELSKFEKAFSVLQHMLSEKADPNVVDSYGNNCLHRAIMDAKQMINHSEADFTDGILLEQIRSVFKELINAGADVNAVSEKRPSALTMMNNFKLGQYELW